MCENPDVADTLPSVVDVQIAKKCDDDEQAQNPIADKCDDDDDDEKPLISVLSSVGLCLFFMTLDRIEHVSDKIRLS